MSLRPKFRWAGDFQARLGEYIIKIYGALFVAWLEVQDEVVQFLTLAEIEREMLAYEQESKK
jgi:hypothetical protein